MNFQSISPVETSKEMLDTAFKKARERSTEKKLKGNWLEVVRKKEAIKLDIIKDVIQTKLQKIHTTFPSLKDLPYFYVELIKVTQDFGEFKRSLAALEWAQRTLSLIHRQYVAKIMTSTNRELIKSFSAQFYGRASSVIKQLDPQLKFLERSRKIMRTYPDIKEMFTVCIYGFPNVGKTTILNQLTGTKAKTAAYAFTTKSINAGYTIINGEKVQFLDVPGTLARDEKMNLIEQQAELVVSELASLIIYVFDLSETSGYSISQQEQLYQKIKKKKNTIVYLNKLDLTPPNVLKAFKHPHMNWEQIQEEISRTLALVPKKEPESEAEEDNL